MHLGNPPLHYIAEVFVVDIEVLPAHRTLCPFFEFVLTVTKKETDQVLSQWIQVGREMGKEGSRFYQSIFLQVRHELVEFFDLQPNSSGQVVVLEAG